MTPYRTPRPTSGQNGAPPAMTTRAAVDSVAAERQQKVRERRATDLARIDLVRSMAVGVAALQRLVDLTKRRRDGFCGLAENLVAIVRARRDSVVDDRLVRAPTGLGEGDPSGGGFLVQTSFAQELVGLAYEESVIAQLCDRRNTQFPLLDTRIPGIDETSRADGSRWGGALAYWASEADNVISTLPRFRNLAFSAKKLIAIAYGSNELMADSPMFEAHIKRVFSAEMSFKIDAAIFAGSSGVPQGLLHSPSLITVDKVTGQAPKTILRENITSMWKRLPAPSRRNAVWLVNEDAEEQLDGLATPIGGTPEVFGQAGQNGNPYPTLKGRPVIAVEQAPPLGSVGDIVLADLSHYILVDGGVMPAVSADVQFVNDEIVFRFVWRLDGQGAFASPIMPYSGSTTRSPFVALGART